MPYVPLRFKPGVDKDNTVFTDSMVWVDSDKVRFRHGFPEQWSGWTSLPDTVVGVPRKLHTWRLLDGNVVYAVATNEKIYIGPIDSLVDVTPVRHTSTLTAGSMATTNASNVITITDNLHGAVNGDYVTISGATAVGGVPATELNAEHKITYVDANTFTITVTTNATSTATGGGTASMEYQINVGGADSTYAVGYGIGGYGLGTYGTARTTGVQEAPRTWSVGNWGEDLVFCPSSGSVYIWDATFSSTRAARIDAAPRKVIRVMVTDDRHLVCFGCNTPASDTDPLDALQVRWCDQENYSDWTASATNTAGGYLLSGGSRIVSAAPTASQNIVWTTDSLYSMQYIGPPYTFGFNLLSTQTGLLAPEAYAVYEDAVFWMSESSFYTYNGGVEPLVSPVKRFVFDSLPTDKTKVFGTVNKKYNEVTWFYPTNAVEDTKLREAMDTTQTTVPVDTTAGFPSSGNVVVGSETISYTAKTDASFTGCTRAVSGTPAAHGTRDVVSLAAAQEASEPCRYVTYNYVENVWWVGRLERTAWLDRKFLNTPIATDQTGKLFYHDTGTSADGEGLTTYAKTGEFDIEEGDKLTFVRRVVPDVKIDSGSVTMLFNTRYYPHSSEVRESVGVVTPTTEKLNVRIRGRQMSLAIESYGTVDKWRLGTPRMDIQVDGRR